ncbi:MAG: hypothetical protein Q9M26_00405 [Mariprofundales bacterium]|nr:hypothetical protein [Mariprofundales bacterium]
MPDNANLSPQVSIAIHCPSCGNHYKFTHHSGPVPTRFHCFACGSEFNLPSPLITPCSTEQPDAAVDIEPPPPPPDDADPLLPSEAHPHVDDEDSIIPANELEDEAPDQTATSNAPENIAIETLPNPPIAPSRRGGRLWPWLLLLLLLISGIGVVLNQQRWLNAPLLLSVRAWWAPQRSLGWEITDIEPQWLPRHHAKPLLALTFNLHNHALFRRSPPPLLSTFRTMDSHHIESPQVVVLMQHLTQKQLMQEPWIPPENDHSDLPANSYRHYSIIFNNAPKLLKTIDLSLN